MSAVAGTSAVAPGPLIREFFQTAPAAPALVALARFTYEPGSFFPPAAGPGPVVFHMVAGKLSFRADAPVYLKSLAKRDAVSHAVPPSTDFDVVPGDQLFVPGNTPHGVHSTGDETAAVVGFAMFPQVPPQKFPAGIAFHPLAMGMASALPPGPLAISLDRIVLTPGSTARRVSSGITLYAIESGTARAGVERGTVNVSRAASAGPFGPPETPARGSAVTLSPGDGVFMQTGSAISFANAGADDVVLLRGSAEAETSASRKAIAARYFYDVWNAGGTAVIGDVVAPDFVNRTPLAGQAAGRDGLVQFVTRWHSAFPDGNVSVDLSAAEGDRVMVRWTWRGTHRDRFLGIAATGAHVTVTGITVLRVSGGTIRESWDNWDQASMIQQMGVIHWPSAAGAR